MKFDGVNWVNVGADGFSAGDVLFINLTFNPVTGNPYVAYSDLANDEKLTVMYYNGPAGIQEPYGLQVSIYPNPAHDRIAVNATGIKKGSFLTITDFKGQEVIKQAVSDEITSLNIGILPVGIYFVGILNKQTITARKFVKQ
jgi:hypothetical protein